MSKNKKQLIEEIGVNLEKLQQLPPLAGRIYGILILCPKSGHTFDDIVELSQASKSSVSTNLNLLLNSGSIEYFTKSGERKRYFRLSKNYLEVTLKQYERRVATELKILHDINRFNRNHNALKYEKHEKFGKLYLAYLTSHYDNLKRTINKMNQLKEV